MAPGADRQLCAGRTAGDSVDREQRVGHRSPSILSPPARSTAAPARHRQPSTLSIIRRPGDLSLVFNKTRLPDCASRLRYFPPWHPAASCTGRVYRRRPVVELAPRRGAGLCPWRLTLVGRSLCPLEGGRSRRSNFLAALNVLRVACCGRHGRQRMDARGAFCARNQIKFSRKHYRTN